MAARTLHNDMRPSTCSAPPPSRALPHQRPSRTLHARAPGAAPICEMWRSCVSPGLREAKAAAASLLLLAAAAVRSSPEVPDAAGEGVRPCGGGADGPGGGGVLRGGVERDAAAAGELPNVRALHLLRRAQGRLRPLPGGNGLLSLPPQPPPSRPLPITRGEKRRIQEGDGPSRSGGASRSASAVVLEPGRESGSEGSPTVRHPVLELLLASDHGARSTPGSFSRTTQRQSCASSLPRHGAPTP